MKKFSLSLIAMALIFLFLFACIKEEEVIIQLPTISTLPITDITVTSVNTGGSITSDGGAEISSRGVVWNINSMPSLENFSGFTIEGSGAGVFQSALKDLQPNTRYYVRAYATNSKGVAYGNEVNFTTQEGLYTIEGYVRNSINNPIKGATVRLGNTKSDDYSIKGNEFQAFHSESTTVLLKSSVVTDENGYYKLEGVRNRKYSIIVEITDYEALAEEITVEGSNLQRNFSLKALELPQIRNVSLNAANNFVNVTWQALSNTTLKGYNHYEQHFFWHTGEWTENQFHVTPKFSSWNKTNNNLITQVATTNYNSSCFNGIIRGKVFGVNIDGVQTSENSATIIRERKLPSKVRTLATFGLGSTSAIEIPNTTHEIALHVGYYYSKYDSGVIDFHWGNYGGKWVVKVSEQGSSSWVTVGSHSLPQGNFVPSGNHGHTITVSLNEYKGKTIYLRTEPAGTFHGLTIKHNLMQYSLDGSDF